jgi:hypothetical protein
LQDRREGIQFPETLRTEVPFIQDSVHGIERVPMFLAFGGSEEGLFWVASCLTLAEVLQTEETDDDAG